MARTIRSGSARSAPTERKPATERRSKLTRKQQEMVTNVVGAMLSRRQLASKLGQSYGGARDLYEVLGYDKVLTFDHYLAEYDRGDIGSRIIDAPPEATWRRKPRIMDDDDPQKITPFEKAWAALIKDRRIFHYIERADKLAGIGEYGVLLLGTSDLNNEKALAKPLAKKLKKGSEGLLSLTPYMAKTATIKKMDSNPGSEHFGLPEVYEIDIAADSPDNEATASKKVEVHWTRVIHIAEGLRENDTIGTPRLQKVYNRLRDMEKIGGGSAEIFWQAAKRIMVLTAREDYASVDDDDALTAMMDEVVHGLRRTIDLQGYEIKTLDPTQVAPMETFEVTRALISAATGIPQRILFGSEQGKLASEQDEGNWNARIADRQTNFAEPIILRPLIDRLIDRGVLPEPQQDWTVRWPTLFEMGEKEKASVGVMRSRAIQQFVGKGGENLRASLAIVGRNEFRSEILGLPAKSSEMSGGASVAEDDIEEIMKTVFPDGEPSDNPQPDNTPPQDINPSDDSADE